MSTQQEIGKHKRLVTYCAALCIGMFAFGYALVPLYSVLCKVTGLNGKVDLVAANAGTGNIDYSRTITVLFLSMTNRNIPWEFRPIVKRVTLHPGENKKVAFFAKNVSGHKMTVQAIPSVTPGIAANYLRKTECFCFTQQTFDENEEHEMPIVFRLDKELPKKISTVTISYTLFDATGIKPKKTQIPGHFGV